MRFDDLAAGTMMAARRLASAVVMCACALACALAAGAGSADAATTQFGEEGIHSGQFMRPYGVAIAQASDDVYAGDRNNYRIDQFKGNGEWVRAWGWGVNEESPAEELQTCTTLCQAGLPGSGAGTYGQESSRGLAADDSGNVYVVDWENFRVEKFDAEGKFILMYGGKVNETTNGDICTEEEIKNSGVKCKAGVEGTADGQFQWAYEGSYIAVGSDGKVYVGDKARIQVFGPSGEWIENISLQALSSEGQVTALAVDAAGDMFVKDSEAAGVREFEPKGTEKFTQFDEGSFSVAALAVDESGDLYVGEESGGFHILRYDPEGKELASFGSKTVGFSQGMAFANTPGELYVAGETIETSETPREPKVFVFTPPAPGPVVEPGSESATPGLKGSATIEAQINPEGHETTYHVEYVDEAHFKESGYEQATSTAPVPLGSSGFEDQEEEEKPPLKVELTGLVEGATYHWRVVASNECKTGETCTAEGEDETFEETPTALVEGPWVTEVTDESATFAAKIVNVQKASTEYRLEYGTSTSYGHVLAQGTIGEGESSVLVSRHVQNLQADTTYHYRVVASNECEAGKTCTVESADHTFMTAPGGGSEFALLDGRTWELVSPASTGGSVFTLPSGGIQAVSNGSAVVYKVTGQPLGENVVSNQFFAGAQVLSVSGPGGWRSEDINPPQSPPGEEDIPENLLLGAGHYPLFSADLTSAVSDPPVFTSLSQEGLKGTGYLRNNVARSFTPLLTPANVPPGTDLEPRVLPYLEKTRQVGVLGGTPDLGHVILGAPLKLTPEAIAGEPKNTPGIGNIYEWSGGRLQLVSILPGESGEATLSGRLAGLPGQAARAVSSDGRWVAWTLGEPYGGNIGYKGLYVRDMVEKKTVQVGGAFSRYQTMSSDGSRVFFLEKGDLYEYDARTGAKTNLTENHGPGEAGAGVQESVSDVSEDGSFVYFVATGVLAEGGVSGRDNLYLLHDAAGKWSTSYVATLASEDEHSWHSASVGTPQLVRVTSRVSPNGRYLTFMSQRSLTGYDNIDASERETEETVGGTREVKTKEHHDEEVYLYDALAGRLVCASCNPTGARPHGVFDDALANLLVEHNGNPAWGEPHDPHWLAGSLPAWELGTGEDTVYQPRYLSDSGRLFFNSPDRLVPHDTNRVEDVYEYEPAGIGGCTGASATFSVRSDGCVDLISSGQTTQESAFMDVSESGDDVFFLASGHLTADDLDTGYDVWDAHVCSASAPCVTSPASPPACTSGDSCKAAPSPQPDLFGPAPSATFSGAGNLVHAASKPLTRAQKLARALRVCKKKKKRKQRTACERKAHKKYAAKHSHKANATKGGGR